MAAEYKKRGGDYNTSKEEGNEKDVAQRSLNQWTKEDWQTKEGSGTAKQDDGTEKRYLPKKAWEKMSEEEKRETDDKKQQEPKEGNQFVSNTEKAQKEKGRRQRKRLRKRIGKRTARVSGKKRQPCLMTITATLRQKTMIWSRKLGSLGMELVIRPKKIERGERTKQIKEIKRLRLGQNALLVRKRHRPKSQEHARTVKLRMKQNRLAWWL